LAHARLTGNWRFGEFRLTPSVAFDYGQEHQQSYTDSNGLLISGQRVSLGRISFGPEVARRFVLDNGAVVEPLASLTGKWDFANGTYASAAGLPADGESFYLKATGGFLARAPGGYLVRLVGSYDGIGNPAFQSWGGEMSVNIPLN
jgi:outer membrane autotransporter protein